MIVLLKKVWLNKKVYVTEPKVCIILYCFIINKVCTTKQCLFYWIQFFYNKNFYDNKTNDCFIERFCFIEQEILFCWKQSSFWFLVNTNELKDRNTFYELFIKPKANMLLDEKKK